MKRSEIQEERFYLLHTRDVIADMCSYTATERDVFLEERMRQDGVIRTLEVRRCQSMKGAR
jgi:uncharacterized protein with HEPN domain